MRVIDGETVVLDDGQEMRLIGALAPKPDALSAGANEWPPAREAARALETLVADRSIRLRFDGRKRDRYGRVLAQAYVVPRGAAGEGGGVWIQERLVRDGHARAYALPGNSGCLRALMAAEQEARDAQRGVWSREIYRVRAADDAEALLRLAGRFALVEGRVAEVWRGQRTTYLNFGTDWRHDFTASLASAALARSADGAAFVSGLTGKRVRVRGWIERRNGPMIVLGSLDAIEVLDERAADAPQSTETQTPR
jgi:endonuclease YncB( thermonuclease family)